MFKIIDTKTSKTILSRITAAEAHKRVDLLNSCGIVRYKAVAV